MPADRLAQSIMPSVTVSRVGGPDLRSRSANRHSAPRSPPRPRGHLHRGPGRAGFGESAGVETGRGRGACRPRGGGAVARIDHLATHFARSGREALGARLGGARRHQRQHDTRQPQHPEGESEPLQDSQREPCRWPRRRRCGDFQVAGAAGGGKAGPAARAASADATMDEGMDLGRICSTPGSDIRSGTRRRSSGNPSRTSSSTVGTSGRPSASNADTMADALHRAVRRGPPTPSRNCRRRASLPTTTWMPLRNSTRSPTSPTGLRGPTRASAISAGDDGITTTAPWTNKRSGPAAPIPFFTA